MTYRLHVTNRQKNIDKTFDLRIEVTKIGRLMFLTMFFQMRRQPYQKQSPSTLR